MKRYAAIFLLFPTLALAAPTPDDISSAAFDGNVLADGQSALAAKVQILLDRAGVSPGVIDGYAGGMTTTALKAFERREGMTADGALDADVWTALGGDDAGELVVEYTITDDDVAGLTPDLPEDFAKLAEMDAIAHESAAERLAERFHMDIDFLKALNTGASFAAGETIAVVATGEPVSGEVARIRVDGRSGRLEALDASGAVIADYPVAVGSRTTPSPSGVTKVRAIAPNPTYTYDPETNFRQGDNDETLILPAGPNGPVGSFWIDLEKPTYGIHGTPDPAKLFQEASHGCVRMTNWDVEELAGMVSPGVEVEIVQ